MPSTPVNTTQAAGGPRRARKGRAALAILLALPPLAWSAQLLVNYAVSSHACFPSTAPRVNFLPGWDWVWPAVLGFNLLMLAFSVIGGALGMMLWRREVEQAKEPLNILEGGHDNAQNLASWAALFGALFFFAIGFNTLELFTVTQCGN